MNPQQWVPELIAVRSQLARWATTIAIIPSKYKMDARDIHLDIRKLSSTLCCALDSQTLKLLIKDLKAQIRFMEKNMIEGAEDEYWSSTQKTTLKPVDGLGGPPPDCGYYEREDWPESP